MHQYLVPLRYTCCIFKFGIVLLVNGLCFWRAIGNRLVKIEPMKTLASILLILLGFFPHAELTNEHLKVFEGEWSGSLTYLNYQDEKTLVTLNLKMEASFSRKGLRFDYYYDEGNGRIEKRNGSFQLKGDKVRFHSKWESESADIEDLENWTLTLVSTGNDNNKPASFKKTVEVSPSKIVVTKMVKFDGESAYFMRNKHVFER